MPKIYLAPYHSNLHLENTIKSDGLGGILDAYVSAIQQAVPWPYDSGDDPSFFSSRYLCGPLTWGTCRGDLRNSINVGSVIVFFSYTQFGQRTTYRLSAIATVKEKIQQNAIYSDAKKQIFRRYLNLLIAPANEAMTKFKWNEPCYPGGQHKNWLWRVVNRSVFTHQDLDGWCPSEIGLGQLVRAKLFCFGNNYVVFATGETETYILANPPKVAVSIDNDVENWCEDSVSQGVFLRTLELARGYAENGRGLRIRGVRQPHCPAVRWRMDDDDALKNWRAEFIAFLKHYGFESRGLKVGR